MYVFPSCFEPHYESRASFAISLAFIMRFTTTQKSLSFPQKVNVTVVPEYTHTSPGGQVGHWGGGGGGGEGYF